ncbi:MAG: hypothetical protein AB7O59_01460 [Pirellulales bacterium]
MKALLATIIVLTAAAANAEDMQKYLNDTQQMVRAKKYAEALERFIWFHEHALEHESSMYGVRLSFALSYWNALGDVYPPAKTALFEMRDRTTQQIINGAATDYAPFHDVVALNRTLNESEKTVDLFLLIDQNNPALAQQCWNVAKDSVVAAKKFDVVRKYVGDGQAAFAMLKESYAVTMKLASDSSPGNAAVKDWSKKHFVDECVQLIEIERALNDEPAAKKIQEQALAVLDDKRLRDALGTEK